MTPALLITIPLSHYCEEARWALPEGSERSLARVKAIFQDVAERLRPGRRFLVDERFTAADLTFAALAAPVLFPPECRATHPTLDAVPPAMREEVARLRDTEAGKFGLRLFAEERTRAS